MKIDNKIKLSHIGILISIIGILIWLFLILNTRIWWVDSSYEFGLFQMLPIYFWLAILLHLAGTLIGVKANSEFPFIVQVIILNIMIWGTAAFIEPNARVLDAWQWLGTTNTIIDSGHIVVNDSATHFYLQWSGSFIFNAILLKCTGVDTLLYLQFYPLLVSTIFIFGYYIWIKRLVKDTVICRCSIILLIFLNLWLQFHFSPQAFGIMLLPIILLTMTKKGFEWRTAMFVLILTLIISHPTTILFLFMIVISQQLIKIVYNIRKGHKNDITQGRNTFVYSLVIILICSMIIIIVLLLASSNFIRLFDLEKAWETLTSIFVLRSQNLSSIIRAVILLGALLAVLASIVYYKKHNEKMFVFSTGWFIGCIIPIFFDITLGGGGFHDRSLMFAYLLIPLLLVQFLWINKYITNFKFKALVIIIVISLLGTYTLYQEENGAIVSDSNIGAAHFTLKYQSDAEIFSQNLRAIYVFDPEIDHNDFIAYSTTPNQKINSNSLVIFDKYSMSLSTKSAEYLRNSYNNYESGNNHRIFDNTKFIIYLTGEGS